MSFEIKNVSKEYRRGDKSFYAVKDISMELQEGDYYCIAGRSGSGKSTLLNLIAGLLDPTSGEIFIDGQNIFTLPDKEASFLRNSKIGYIPQGQSLLNNLSVFDNVRIPHFLGKYEGDAAEKAMTLLEQVGLSHLANLKPQQLSGGELRRVAIARALVNNPKLILADEPTNDLDAKLTADILNIFSKVAEGGTAVLMVTHDLDAVHYCDKVYKMELGQFIQQ